MKRFFTLLLSSLFSLSLFAFDGSKLSISTATKNNDLSIEVDGRRLNMQGNAITLSNIPEGYHTVKIIRDKKKNNGRGWGANRKQDVVYSNSLFIKRGFHTDITVNRFGKVFIDERRMDRNDDWYNDDDYYDDGDGGWDDHYNNNVMTAREFDMLKESLRKEWFEASRVTSAKVVMDKSNFTSQQVKELLQLFTFENNKLELAKYAYRNTVDKRSYFVVNDVFSFNSSRDELARFIRDFR
jgi:hypothetical protein